jgi:hypothetical protein
VAARRIPHRRTADSQRAVADPVDQTIRERIAPTVPDGWVGLDEAARILGVARQTVLHKVQRELEAVHVNRGRRKGLAINVFQRPGWTV